MVRFAWGVYKLLLCLVSKLVFCVCYEKVFVLNCKHNKDNRYCDVKGKICSFLNKFLHETVFPHPSIILIAFFCIQKIVELCGKFPQNIIP
jgi:hypothetical protein